MMNPIDKKESEPTHEPDLNLNTGTPKRLFMVDDDALFLRTMAIAFEQHTNFTMETFSTGEQCLDRLSNHPDIIILDFHLDSQQKDAMNGLAVLDAIKKFNPDIPVIMLSSQDKIEVAVTCMRHKALDYVVKSETSFLRLQKIITTFLHYQKMQGQLNWYMDRM